MNLMNIGRIPTTQTELRKLQRDAENLKPQTMSGTVVISQPTTSGGGSSGGVTVHNDLTGRGANDTHPIAAITGLRAELDALDKVELLKYTAGITYGPTEIFTNPTGEVFPRFNSAGIADCDEDIHQIQRG